SQPLEQGNTIGVERLGSKRAEHRFKGGSAAETNFRVARFWRGGGKGHESGLLLAIGDDAREIIHPLLPVAGGRPAVIEDDQHGPAIAERVVARAENGSCDREDARGGKCKPQENEPPWRSVGLFFRRHELAQKAE